MTIWKKWAGACILCITICSPVVSGETGGVAQTSINAGQAQKIALEQTKGGEVLELEKVEGKNETRFFRIEIANGGNLYSVAIDANDGDLLKFVKKDGTGTPLTDAPGVAQAKPMKAESRQSGTVSGGGLTINDAKEVALKYSNGGKIKEIEIDSKKGRLLYEVEVINDGTKYEIYIDATTGEVVKSKVHKKRHSR